MSDKKIKIYSRWGNPKLQADLDAKREIAKRANPDVDDAPHGFTPAQIEKMDEKLRPAFEAKVAGGKTDRRSLMQSLLPEGREVPLRRRAYGGTFSGAGDAGGSVYQSQQPYLPEFASRDRQSYPMHRRLANTYWRLFYKMDPTIGSVIRMKAKLPWSDVQFTGEGVDGSIKEAMEYAWRECEILANLVYFCSEEDVVGEVVPHLMWDDAKGLWTHLACHNPDQINVIHSPFVKMDPIIEFVPDEKLKEIATSTHPMLARVRDSMPDELLNALRAGDNIPLASTNASFIANKLHPYDLRGTSSVSNLWRCLMGEDYLWDAFLSTAKRAAAPLKVIKLGSDTHGHIPGPAEEQRLLQKLAEAESDVQAWLVYNNMISFEMVGNSDRLLSINTHYDLFERIKLASLGVSKAFLSGDSTYTASAAGLTIFLQNMKARRDFYVHKWLIPKFFMPMAIANEWIKPSKSRASGGHVRVKRSSKELLDDNHYVMPTLEWSKSLDSQIDRDRIDAMQTLEQSLGIKLSDQKKFACLGLDSEEEQKQIIEEIKFKRQLAGQDPQLAAAIGLAAPEAPADGMGGGGGPGMISPGIPPAAFGVDDAASDGGLPMDDAPMGDDSGSIPSEVPLDQPLGAELQAGDGGTPTSPRPSAKSAPKSPKSSPNKHWDPKTIHNVQDFMERLEPKDLDEPWIYAVKDRDVQKAIATGDPLRMKEAFEQWLVDENYPQDHIVEFVRSVKADSNDAVEHDVDLESLSRIEAQILGKSEYSDLIKGKNKSVK